LIAKFELVAPAKMASLGAIKSIWGIVFVNSRHYFLHLDREREVTTGQDEASLFNFSVGKY
jgi:hypothetical protein